MIINKLQYNYTKLENSLNVNNTNNKMSYLNKNINDEEDDLNKDNKKFIRYSTALPISHYNKSSNNVKRNSEEIEGSTSADANFIPIPLKRTQSSQENHLYFLSSDFTIKPRTVNRLRESVKEEKYTRIIAEKADYSIMDNIQGALLMTFSSFVYAFLLMLQKFIFMEYPKVSFGQQNIFRGSVLIIVNTIVIKNSNSSFYFNKREINITLAKRVLFGFFAELLLFLGTNYLRINTSSTFYILYSVICSLVSGIVLNELITNKDIIIIVSCFFSACLIVKPFFGKGEDTLIGIIMGMTSSIGFCMMVIYHKFLDPIVSNYTINFYFGVCYLIEGVVTFILGDDEFIWETKAIAYLMALSIIYAFSCYLFIVAINCGKVSYILPFENTNVVFSILLGHFVLGEGCDYLDITGTVCILGICTYRCVVLILEDEEENTALRKSKEYRTPLLKNNAIKESNFEEEGKEFYIKEE